jgi:hypothetical protein
MRAKLKPENPADCWDWLTLNDLNRMTKQALRSARIACNPPRGEPWLDAQEGVSWCDSQTFVDSLVWLLEVHVRAEAHRSGVSGNDAAPAQLAKWNRQQRRSPLVMGHGCPAPSAGGPGCMAASVLDAGLPSDIAVPYSSERRS